MVVWSLPWEPEQASTQAGPIDTLYDVLALISAFVLRARDEHPDRGGGPLPQAQAGRPARRRADPRQHALEVVWTTIPAILMVGTAVYSGLVLADIEETKADTQHDRGHRRAVRVDLRVPGRQSRSRRASCTWSRTRPTSSSSNAKDVIHSFWVPQFRMKKDAVPGITTEVRVTPKRKGRYTLACTELCGLGHSTMRATVVVEDQAGFDRWAERSAAARSRSPAGWFTAGRPGRRHASSRTGGGRAGEDPKMAADGGAHAGDRVA